MVPALIFSLISLAGIAATTYVSRAAMRMRRRDRERRRLLRVAVQVTGTVIAVGEEDSTHSSEIRPEIHFLAVTGQEYKALIFETWPPVLQPGQSVMVAYDPADPEHMTLAQNRPGTKVSHLILMSVLLGTLTFVTVFFTVRLWAVSSGHGFDLPGVDVPGVVLPSNR